MKNNNFSISRKFHEVILPRYVQNIRIRLNFATLALYRKTFWQFFMRAVNKSPAISSKSNGQHVILCRWQILRHPFTSPSRNISRNNSVWRRLSYFTWGRRASPFVPMRAILRVIRRWEHTDVSLKCTPTIRLLSFVHGRLIYGFPVSTGRKEKATMVRWYNATFLRCYT